MEIDPSKIGLFNLEKGLVRTDVQMFAWDGIQECRPECPMSNECKYPHKGKCAVQFQYVQTLYKSILTTYSYLDEAMLFKIGMELIPLYIYLVKLQIVELSLPSLIATSEKGIISIHPIYREIRETLKTIQILWKGMDMTFSFGEKSRLQGMMKGALIEGEDGKTEPSAKDLENGDPNFYKKISKEGPSRKGVIR